MSGWKKLASAAAASGEVTNVEDVFSVYNYHGTGQPLAIDNGLALGDGPTGELGSSTSFNGNGDYLSKSSDLTGNADGKTFTCSFWVYIPRETLNANNKYIYHTSGSWRNTIYVGGNGSLFVAFYNNESSGGTVFEIQEPRCIPKGGWTHVLFSADLTNTARRHLYINDQLRTPSYTFVNNTIDWTRTTHAIGDDLTNTSTGYMEGNLAHFYLDYTYRDLSVTSNRRYFIDAAGGSTSVATQSALNPILYLPMTSSVGANEGTGGNFTASGSPAIVSNFGTEAVAGAGQGGITWIKNRRIGESNLIYRNDNGTARYMSPNSTSAETTPSDVIPGYGLYKFNGNGFTLGGNYAGENGTATSSEYISWSFRKATKFFDIVTWTGDSTSNRSIPHNLGSAPGMIWVKSTTYSSPWTIYHRGMHATAPEDYYMQLNTQAKPNLDSSGAYWGGAQPTSTQFTIGNAAPVNAVGETFVAYLFAHNDGDGEFGPNADQDIIKCGVYTGNDSTNPGNTIDLGFEPQMVFLMDLDTNTDRLIFDTTRGMPVYDLYAMSPRQLKPNEGSYSEANSTTKIEPYPSGFRLHGSTSNTSGRKYAYMAVRRGPMATVEDATKVFHVADGLYDTSSPYDAYRGNNFLIDMSLQTYAKTAGPFEILDRYRMNGNYGLAFVARTDSDAQPSQTGAGGYSYRFDRTGTVGLTSVQNMSGIGYLFSRAPGFFDVLQWAGDGTTSRTIQHSLGVAPEMIWMKITNASGFPWVTGAVFGASNYRQGVLNTNASHTTTSYSGTAAFASAPTSSSIELGSYFFTNGNGYDVSAYLFASLPGVSKVGTYTGNGSTQNIDCGFTNGARLVIIKRTDANENWYVFDALRGINPSGTNDPALRLDTDAGQFTSAAINPYSAGFQVEQSASCNNNVSGGSYIFLAIA